MRGGGGNGRLLAQAVGRKASQKTKERLQSLTSDMSEELRANWATCVQVDLRVLVTELLAKVEAAAGAPEAVTDT